MSATSPHFWRQPFRYMRWAAHEKPAIFFSIIIGCAGPLGLVLAPPIKKAWGWEPRPGIPMTYPIPKGPRQIPEGYDD